jgi:hypothetical protein
MTKFCKSCGVEKSLSDFYSHPATKDGTSAKCKECTKVAVRSNRAKNIDHYKAFDKARGMSPDRVAARKAYQATAAGQEAMRRARRRYQLKAPERRAAHVAFGNAVRDGRVIPWPVCAVPECCGKPQGHHADYSLPLDVTWLCDHHHKETHKLARELKRAA